MAGGAIGILGLGRMGEAIAKAALSIPNQAKLYVTSRNAERAARLVDISSRVVVAEPDEILQSCDYIVISLGSQVARDLLPSLEFAQRHQLVSVMAEIGHDELQNMTKGAGSVSRVLTLPSVAAGGQFLPCFRPNAAATQLFAENNELVAFESERDLMALWSITGLLSSIMMMGDIAARWLKSTGIDKQYAATYSRSLFAEVHDLTEHGFEAGKVHVSTPGGLNVMMVEYLQRAGIEQQFSEGLTLINQRLLKSTGKLRDQGSIDTSADAIRSRAETH